MSALKTILIFLAGAVVGAGLLFGYLQYYTQRQFARLEEEIQNNIPTFTQDPSATTSPLNEEPGLEPSPGTSGSNLQEQFQASERSIRTTIAEAFPNLGFIAQDAAGTRIFVEWPEAAPAAGQAVTVTGELSRFSAATGIAGQTELPPAVQEVLTQTPYFIEATQVEPAL